MADRKFGEQDGILQQTKETQSMIVIVYILILFLLIFVKSADTIWWLFFPKVIIILTYLLYDVYSPLKKTKVQSVRLVYNCVFCPKGLIFQDLEKGGLALNNSSREAEEYEGWQHQKLHDKNRLNQTLQPPDNLVCFKITAEHTRSVRNKN